MPVSPDYIVLSDDLISPEGLGLKANYPADFFAQ